MPSGSRPTRKEQLSIQKPRPKLRDVRELNFEGFIFYAPDMKHVLQTQEWQNTFRIEFNNGAYSDDDIVDVFAQRLTTPFNIYKNVFIPVGEYHWTRHQLGSSQERKLMVNFFEPFGTYYDGHLNEARIRGTYRANERLSFSLAEQWNRFRLGIVSDSAGNDSIIRASANIRLRWNYRPDSDLFFIYTAGQRFATLVAANPPQYYENRFAIQFTYSWRP